jgi:hypothetical protein
MPLSRWREDRLALGMESEEVLSSPSFRRLFEGEPLPLLREQYVACGCVCALTTNSEDILASVRQSFTTIAPSNSAVDFELRLWVDNSIADSPPWKAPYFRGLSHFVFGGFGSESAVLVDLRRRCMVGRLSTALAADSAYWRRVILPALFGIVSPTVRLAALHCACVEREGRGLLLAGESGSGKSTLSLALAQTGFRFVADDWTYLSRQGDRLQAWALPTPLKLLADARDVFPELTTEEAARSLNGEMAYEVEPDRVFGVRRAECAEPHWLMFLERSRAPGLALEPMSAVDAAARFEADLEGLPAPVSEHRDFLVKTVRILSRRPCWRLRYGDSARAVAHAVTALIDTGAGLGRSEAQPEVRTWPA